VRLLLDTHALLWWLARDRRLGHDARAQMVASGSVTWVSAASIWEAAIRFALRRLPLEQPPVDVLSETAIAAAGFRTLAITGAHALSAGSLPRHHNDPFDRMLIAQARAENLTIVTSDPAFDDYDVRVLDARR
jgi:PIN domain nuclease of toxin-antitoxin system